MGWGGGYGGEGRGRLYNLSLHCHHQNDFCVKMGSDESHLNVSLIVREKVTIQRSVHDSQPFFGEKGQPNRNRAEALLLTSLTPKLC